MVCSFVGTSFLTFYLRDARSNAVVTQCVVLDVVKQPCRAVGTTGASVCGYITVAASNASSLSCAPTNQTSTNGTVSTANVELDYAELSDYARGQQIECLYDPRDCSLWSFLTKPPIWPLFLLFPALLVGLALVLAWMWIQCCAKRANGQYQSV